MNFKHFQLRDSDPDQSGAAAAPDAAALAAQADADAIARGDVLSDGKVDPKVDELIDPLATPAKTDEEIAAEAVAKVEADATAAAAAAKGEGEDDKKKDTRIPLARHKEMMEKGRLEREALQAQIAQYQQGAQVAVVNEQIEVTETKLIGLETEYNKLLADGDIEKATAKMTEIRRLERTIGEQKTSMLVQAAEARAVERVRFDTTVARLESAYPVLSPDHEDYDKAIVSEVLELQDAFKAKGATPSDALQRAVKYVLGAETKKEKAAVEVTPKVDAAAAVAAERKAAATATAVAAAKATPANTSKVGLNSDEKGGVLTAERVAKMSQKEFAALNEADLARMRGDTVE